MSPIGYAKDGWCQFEFILVVTAFFDQVAHQWLAHYLPVPPMLLRVLRMARILRVMRILKGIKGLRDLLWTLVFSGPSLFNGAPPQRSNPPPAVRPPQASPPAGPPACTGPPACATEQRGVVPRAALPLTSTRRPCAVGSLLGLIIFIYSILGVNLFSFVQYGDSLNEYRNFESVSNAALVLFQCVTADDWSGLMGDAMITPAGGCSYEVGDCGTLLALPYFLTFMLIASFVFLNLIVAVVIENYAMIEKEDPTIASQEAIDAFKDAWALHDPDGKGAVPMDQMVDLVLEIPQPLGLQGVAGRRQALHFCMQLPSLGLRQSDWKDPYTGEARKDGLLFKDVLDALLTFNAKQMGVHVDLGKEHESGDSGEKAEGVKTLLSLRSDAFIHNPEDEGKAYGGLTTRRRGVAQMYAREALAQSVARKHHRMTAVREAQERRRSASSQGGVMGDSATPPPEDKQSLLQQDAPRSDEPEPPKAEPLPVVAEEPTPPKPAAAAKASPAPASKPGANPPAGGKPPPKAGSGPPKGKPPGKK